MKEHLSIITALLEQYDSNKKREILLLLQESYFYRDKKVNEIIKDISLIRKKKKPKYSELLINRLEKKDLHNKNTYDLCISELQKDYEHYYTVKMINKIIWKEKIITFFQFLIPTLLTIISLILFYIAYILKNID